MTSTLRSTGESSLYATLEKRKLSSSVNNARGSRSSSLVGGTLSSPVQRKPPSAATMSLRHKLSRPKRAGLVLRDHFAQAEEDDHAGQHEFATPNDFGPSGSSVVAFRRQWWFRLIILTACTLSLTSVCMNTPRTFKRHPSFLYVTLVIDCIVALVLLFEMAVKISEKGLWTPIMASRSSYLRSGGRIFEAVMLFFVFVSIVLQVIEMSGFKPDVYTWYSAFRSPRPLIFARVVKSILHLGLPKTVSQRSFRQIWSVLLFSIYFMALTAVIGVQIFGPLKYFCLKSGVDSANFSVTDLTVPVTRCASGSGGHSCPGGFQCVDLKFSRFRQDMHYFQNAANGLLTVYETSSMEGWSFVMYAAMDTHHFGFAVTYFVFSIFFVAWLVKNVFIAIVTETFADIRSDVHNLWTFSARNRLEKQSKVFRTADSNLQLVDVDQSHRSSFQHRCEHVMKSWPFLVIIYAVILFDAITQAILAENIYLPIIFTVFFDLEALFKIWVLGVRSYLKNIVYRFELVLCIGSTLFLAPVVLDYEVFMLFNVLRPFRFALAWSGLTSFTKRILGSMKKLGSLVFVTLSFLIAMSGVSLQLFCNIEAPSNDALLFQTFPEAIQNLFQVLMQEGWNEVMNDLLFEGQARYAALTFCFFIAFHIIASVILISVFVALILDNLELDEELKELKQRKLGEEVADIQEKLPLRLRVFAYFKANPKVVKLHHVDCNIPKVRESFMSRYLEPDETVQNNMLPLMHRHEELERIPVGDDSAGSLGYLMTDPKDSSSFAKSLRKQSTVTQLIKESHMKKISSVSPGDQFRSGRHSTFAGSIRRRLSRRGASQSSSGKTSVGSANVGDIAIRTRKLQQSVASAQKSVSFQHKEKRGRDIDISSVRQKLEEAQRRKEEQVDNLRENYPMFDQSLFALPYNNPLRSFLRKVVHARYEAFPNNKDKKYLHSAFSIQRFKKYLGSQTYLDWLMIFLTQISCLFMTFETKENGTFDRTATAVMEYVFVFTTTIELTIKILADGLFFTPKALVQNFAGILHVFIYIVSLVYVIWQPAFSETLSVAQFLLVLRSLRPLRIITLAPPLIKVIQILIRGYKDIFKVAVLQFLLMFCFASYGMQMFSGKLKKCNDPSIITEWQCIGLFYAPVSAGGRLRGVPGGNVHVLVPRVWRNPRNYDFDNLGNAFLAMFEVLSLEGWTEVRDILRAQVGVWASFYPHIYVFLACLIGLTLFIGVVVSNFNENKGTALLTVDQRRWEDLKKRLKLSQPLHMPARPEASSLIARCYDLLQTKTYDVLYFIVVVINTLTLAFGEWSTLSLSSDRLRIFTTISVVCCALYVFDMVIKISAYKFLAYWLSMRNRFDFLLTFAGIVWITLNYISLAVPSLEEHSLRLGVSIVILRFLSLSGKHSTLRMLMLTVVMSLFQSFFTVSVLVVLMMCYALAGVVLFGAVKFGVSLDRHANFQTFWKAMLLLFRITTGEDWNKIMHDVMISEPYCTEDKSGAIPDCGNRVGATVFFFSYYLLITYIFLNLFIAVVIENFSIFYTTDEDPLMSNADIQSFQETWNMVDVERRSNISVIRARLVLRLLRGRLEIDVKKDKFLFKRMCCEIDKLRNGKNVSFHDLLFVLAYKSIDLTRNLQLEERLAREEHELAIMEEVAAQTIRNWFVRMWRERKFKEREPAQHKMSVSSGKSEVSEEYDSSKPYDMPSPRLSSAGSSYDHANSVTGSPSHLGRPSHHEMPDIAPLNDYFLQPSRTLPTGRRISSAVELAGKQSVDAAEIQKWWNDQFNNLD